MDWSFTPFLLQSHLHAAARLIILNQSTDRLIPLTPRPPPIKIQVLKFVASLIVKFLGLLQRPLAVNPFLFMCPLLSFSLFCFKVGAFRFLSLPSLLSVTLLLIFFHLSSKRFPLKIFWAFLPPCKFQAQTFYHIWVTSVSNYKFSGNNRYST